MRQALLVVAICLWGVPAVAGDGLESQFRNPPTSARAQTWWHWMCGNVTREGITQDLEAMQRVGLGGFEAFHVDQEVPPGPVGYLTPQWRELMSHAAQEADRLGLEMCLHNCAGWSSSGGPWISPDLAMQELTWTESSVEGPGQQTIHPPQPESHLDFYRDIAVLAFPTPQGGQDRRIDAAREKAGFGVYRFNDRYQATNEQQQGIATDAMVDLTDRLDATGGLTWDVPAGRWTVLRIGYTPTGKTNHPAPAEGRGLECDKMSQRAVDVHWNSIVQVVLDDAGPAAGKSLNNVLIDSYEVGHQNWTAAMGQEFAARRGYDLRPYLPALTGRVVQDAGVTERFLWDFRLTLAELIRDNYFGHFAKLCHDRGLKLSIEPYVPVNFDAYQVAELADVPMGEFWASGEFGDAEQTVKTAASAAHALNRTYVGAESFTSAPDRSGWIHHPRSLKRLGDHYYCQGLNRVIFHTFAHQPWGNDVLPGMTMGRWGMQMNRNNTWFGMARPWLDYLARTQYLLQQGQSVNDLCYLMSESAPAMTATRRSLEPAVPAGYDYDQVSIQLLRDMQVDRGLVQLPSGMQYQMLVLPAGDLIRPEWLREVLRLVDSGAQVCGGPYVASPSLEDYPACDQQVTGLAGQIWRGQPNVHESGDLAAVLSGLGLAADFAAVSDELAARLEYVHRRTDDADIYFVTNQSQQSLATPCLFRVAGKQPELWHPTTGHREDAAAWKSTDDGRTQVVLNLAPAESVFVVFRRAAGDDQALASGEGAAARMFTTQIPSFEGRVVRAVYGVPGGNPSQSVDVTDKVTEFLQSSRDGLPVDNRLAGDPAVNIVKQLAVQFVLDGETHEIAVPENQLLERWSFVEAADAAPRSKLALSQGALLIEAMEPGHYVLRANNGKQAAVDVPDALDRQGIVGPWLVTLPQLDGSTTRLSLPELQSLSEIDDDAARYFAGTATYDVRFMARRPDASKDEFAVLSLGDVEVIAEVELNGESLGTLWAAPLEVDVTRQLRDGENHLVVRVATLWGNRLVGDARLRHQTAAEPRTLKAVPAWVTGTAPRPDDSARTFTTYRHWDAEEQLLPAGLVGPVELLYGRSLPVELQ